MSGERPWPAGAATGIGPMPGVDPLAALQVVLDVLPVLPFLPTLPARGPGSDPVGRTIALLSDMWAEVGPTGWRLTGRPGRDAARAADARRADLDALEEAVDQAGGTGRLLKVSVVGPLSLSAVTELASGHRVVRDPGAADDVAAALADGLAQHLGAIRARIPAGWDLLVELDEPFLGAVLSGEVPTPSGMQRYAAVERGVARERLSRVCGDVGAPCGFYSDAAALDLLTQCGAVFVGAPLDVLETTPEEPLGEALEAGVGLLAGVDTSSGPKGAAERVRDLWRRFGLAGADMSKQVAVCPAGDLSSTPLVDAGRTLEQAVETARRLEDEADRG